MLHFDTHLPDLWGFAPDPSKGGLMAPPSALPRLRGQTDSRFALVAALERGQPQNTYHSTGRDTVNAC
jgi:hypothetical protein